MQLKGITLNNWSKIVEYFTIACNHRVELFEKVLYYYSGMTIPYLTKTPVKRTIFFSQVVVKCMEKNLDMTNPRYNEQIFPVPW